MNKFFSLLVISTALFVTAGCGNKKQTKAIISTTTEAASAETVAKDTKEDYSIAA